MPTYNPPLRDMQFVLHEVFNVEAEFKAMPAHADTDADTINAVLEEAGKFAAEVAFPLNISGDAEGCTHNKQELQRDHAQGLQRSLRHLRGRRLGLPCWVTPSLAARACPTP